MVDIGVTEYVIGLVVVPCVDTGFVTGLVGGGVAGDIIGGETGGADSGGVVTI